MVTLSDVAHRLGISSSTVSKALNGAYDVSDELRSQILTTAVSMGYLSRRQYGLSFPPHAKKRQP